MPPPAEPVVVVGAGEHARVVADAIRSRPDRWSLAGFVDRVDDSRSPSTADARSADGDAMPSVRDEAAFQRELSELATTEGPHLALGIGAPLDAGLRREVVGRYGDTARWGTIVHASASVSPDATLEDGVVVLAGAVIGPGARIGAHAIVNNGAVVEHDVAIGAFGQIGPGAVIGGGVTIGEDVLIGLGARVRDHMSVGAGAVVGMGAVVVADVSEGTTVIGIPARPDGSARSRRPAGTGREDGS